MHDIMITVEWLHDLLDSDFSAAAVDTIKSTQMYINYAYVYVCISCIHAGTLVTDALICIQHT